MNSKMSSLIMYFGQLSATAIVGAMAIHSNGWRGLMAWFAFAWMAMIFHVLVQGARGKDEA